MGRLSIRVVLPKVAHVKLPVYFAEVIAVRRNHSQKQKHGRDLAQCA